MSTQKPLTALQVEPVTEPLGKAFAVAILLAEAQSLDETCAEVAAVLVDLIAASRVALSALVADDARAQGGAA